MKQDKNIDKLFKHGLEDPVDETRYREDDWNAFEQLLDKEKRPVKILWLPILSSVAAILIVVFGWWMFKPQATGPVKNGQQQLAANNKPLTQPSTIVKVQPSGQQPLTPNIRADKGLTGQHQLVIKDRLASNKSTANKKATGKLPAGLQFGSPNNNGNTVTEKLGSDHKPVAGGNNYTALTAVKPEFDHTQLVGMSRTFDIAENSKLPAVTSIDILPTVRAIGIDASTGAKGKLRKTGATSLHPQFALTILAASEMNGVGSFQNTNAGSNIGLLFSVGVKKFKLSTGANYSLKPYTLPFDQYHTAYQFKNSPLSVSADCRVLDIPLNIDYQVYNKFRNKISIGTGLSSYIMMHESYSYDYGNASVSGPSSYDVKTRGKYLFSIMNLTATYQRQVNSKVGISLQPYLKLPLSDIGYSQAKVQTFGVAVGLSWNINSLIKPK